MAGEPHSATVCRVRNKVVNSLVILVATSTGGLAALRTLISAWPASLPASIFVVMHVVGT